MKIAIGIVLFLIGSSLSAAVAQSVAKPGTLEEKVASVLPRPEEERWLQIPWRTDLVEARSEAQRLKKPLFLWIMDGHPLACV